MTLREKILKTFIVTIREINTHGGPEEFFKKYPVGGMYYSEAEMLLDENNMEMGTATTFEKLNECKAASKNKLLVCADNAAIRGQKIVSSQRSLGATPCEEDAYNFGKITGMQMNDKGIDWVLGPSIDLYYEHSMPLMAISDDPQVIADTYRQVIKGIQEQGVCATAKHFPGLGASGINMHFAPGQNSLPFDTWMETYGYTYKEMFKEDVMCVMTTHVSLKSYDNEFHDGYYPIATYSEKLTVELLKQKLGFKGAVVTDALIMGGMATGDLIEETVQAFKAGADLLLWPPVEAADRIEELILSGEIPMSRLDDALARIERMENFRNKALAEKSFDAPDAEFADKKALELIKNGICQLRNDINLLPLNKEKYKNVLIVDGTDDTKSSELLRDAFIKKGVKAEVQRDIYDVPSRVCWQADVDKLQAQYDLVIFNMNTTYSAAWTVPLMLIWSSHLFDKSKKLIINYGSPYFASDFFPEDTTFIEMNCRPTKESVDYLVEGLFGEAEFRGKSLITGKGDEVLKSL